MEACFKAVTNPRDGRREVNSKSFLRALPRINVLSAGIRHGRGERVTECGFRSVFVYVIPFLKH